jgi:uncharacterized integral membrane protein
MRYVYIALIVAFTGTVLLFMFQNIGTVTVSLATMSVTLPVSLLVAVVYLLGMVTGSALISLLRGWIKGARRLPERSPE